jgi:hypothetical protein
MQEDIFLRGLKHAHRRDHGKVAAKGDQAGETEDSRP